MHARNHDTPDGLDMIERDNLEAVRGAATLERGKSVQGSLNVTERQ
jgi:hypothetical protein